MNNGFDDGPRGVSPVRLIIDKPSIAELVSGQREEEDLADGTLDGLDEAMAAEAARLMIIDSELSLAGIADDVLKYDGNNAWLDSEGPRIDSGASDIMRDDLIYQNPDWDRATGRDDLKSGSDLIG